MEVELLVLGRRHVVVYLYLRLEPIFFTNVASFRQVCFRIAVLWLESRLPYFALIGQFLVIVGRLKGCRILLGLSHLAPHLPFETLAEFTQ